MLVHPKFKEKLPFPNLGMWPRKDQYYLSYDVDVNILNGAINVVLITNQNNKTGPGFYIEGFVICCYSMKQVLELFNVKVSMKHLYQFKTYCKIGNNRGHKQFLSYYLNDWKLVYIFGNDGKTIEYCDFMYNEDVHYNHRSSSWGVKSFIKNLVSANSFLHLDKDNIYSLFPNWVEESFIYQNKLPEVHKEGDIWIVKPVGLAAHSGVGISIVMNEKDLETANKGIGKMPATIQRYITDPILFDGKKFHIRVWLMVTSWGHHHIYPYYKVATANLPYIKGDWYNPKIHDTHFYRTTGNPYWEADELYTKLIRNLCFDITQTINIEKYEESVFGYQILGLDLMMSKNKVHLIEVNTFPGRFQADADEDLYKRDLKWEIDCLRFLFSKSTKDILPY